MIKFFKISLCAILLTFPLLTSAQTQERILSYDSKIEVKADSSMIVTETIKVISAHQQINHGIYRDFPIAYKDQLGHRYQVGFELLDAKRDGMAEQYHIERGGNGLRIYIGKKDTLVPLGEQEYVLTYKTDRQLGFFQDHDELYWNVTGNGWVFPIDSATATIKLPNDIPKEKITTALYTGRQGSTAKDGMATVTGNSVAEFKTTRPLGPNEGLTIAVGWPKGYITPPTKAQNLWAGLKANSDYIVGILGFLLVLAFYLYMWNKHGRDPKKGTIIPYYEPPCGFSPGLLRFINRMGNDNRAFASAIIDLGVRNKLTVTEVKGLFWSKTYTLTKKSEAPQIELPKEEQILMDEFFSGADSYKLEKENATETLKIREKFADSLKEQAGRQFFSRNILVVVGGALLSLGVVALAIISAVFVRFSVDSLLPIMFWPIFILAMVAVNIIFAWLMRAYTLEGRKLADEIEGFKWFLTVTEKDRLNFHNPPEKTPELFEKILPYALALDVEHQWAQQFAEVFARLDNRGVKYAPLWYYGSLTHFSANDFASTVGKSFTGAVAAASTPPGSGSGFSGGGSGGGGGGGGGGGW